MGAPVNFYLTSSDKIDRIEIKKGNLIFAQDVRKIFLDNDEERVAYDQIMCLATDDMRTTMLGNLVSGFYFILETNILWRLDGQTWIQITEKPSQQLVYGTLATFPRPGLVGTIYYTDTNMYHWDEDKQAYVDYCLNSPEWIIER